MLNFVVTYLDCQVNDAPSFDGGMIIQTPSGQEPHVEGATLTYSCIDPSNDLIGTNVVSCQLDGSWTPNEIGTCVQKSKY